MIDGGELAGFIPYGYRIRRRRRTRLFRQVLEATMAVQHFKRNPWPGTVRRANAQRHRGGAGSNPSNWYLLSRLGSEPVRLGRSSVRSRTPELMMEALRARLAHPAARG